MKRLSKQCSKIYFEWKWQIKYIFILRNLKQLVDIDIDKSQDIKTFTFKSNSWLQQKAAKVYEDLRDIFDRDKEHSKSLLVRDDHKECAENFPFLMVI